MAKDKLYQEMYNEYKKGFSLDLVGKKFGKTRQAVYCGFKLRNFVLRKKKFLPYKIFNHKKYTLRNNGYYGKTDGKRTLMHIDVWEYHNGKIPKGFDIHHKNKNKIDNRITNLELMKKDEHARQFSTGNNQYTKKRRG